MLPRRLFAGFRGRLVLAVTLLTLATVGAAFVAIYETVNLSQQRRLDRALLSQARREAAELARHGDDFVISDRPGPSVNDAGPLPKHGAVIEARAVKIATPGFALTALDLMKRLPGLGRGFDFGHDGVHMRGVAVDVPGRPGLFLVLAVPRTDLDGDAAFLARAMRLVFLVALAWTSMVAWVIVRRLTRVHQRIAHVVHSVAEGNLSTRVAPGAARGELAEMGRDIDELIDRLSALLQSQQQFIAHAAHELRSPLTTLYGELSLALRRPRSGEEYQRVVEDALESARRLKLLADDLLALARVGSKTARESNDVSLDEVLKEAVAQIRSEIERAGLTVRLPAAAPAVKGRHPDLVRLFRNLLENAVRYSSPGGEIEVVTDAGAETIRISVSDHGPGIDLRDRERIFEPFYRAAEDRAGAHEGAGLGLPIARHLASLHGGSVELAPDPKGTGACFVVTLARGAPA